VAVSHKHKHLGCLLRSAQRLQELVGTLQLAGGRVFNPRALQLQLLLLLLLRVAAALRCRTGSCGVATAHGSGSGALLRGAALCAMRAAALWWWWWCCPCGVAATHWVAAAWCSGGGVERHGVRGREALGGAFWSGGERMENVKNGSRLLGGWCDWPIRELMMRPRLLNALIVWRRRPSRAVARRPCGTSAPINHCSYIRWNAQLMAPGRRPFKVGGCWCAAMHNKSTYA
jgi:hypothetical protein